MLIPCKDIGLVLENYLSHHIRELIQKPKLITFLLGSAPEQLSFVEIKKRLADRIGASFELRHYPEDPPFTAFRNKISDTAQLPDTTGIIIQHPLPAGFDPASLYSVIPHQKEIEGHIPGSSFHFPLSLAVLAGIKYVILKELRNDYTPGEESIVNFSGDREPLSEYLSGKKIVIVGRGITGGKPIGKILSDLNVPFTMINSETKTPETYYKNADMIITAVGKKILKPSMIKKGVVLLNVGLRKENGKLKGDYDEEEIKDIASYYTETPGGLGPLDVLYLYKNLYDASNL